MKIKLIILIVVFNLVCVNCSKRYTNHALYRIKFNSTLIQNLQQLADIDIWQLSDDAITLQSDSNSVEKFLNHNRIDYEILTQNVQRWIDAEQRARTLTSGHEVSRYRTFDQVS